MKYCMPISRLRNHMTPDGRRMKRLDYNVRMLPSGGSVTFDVEVNGTRLGSKKFDMRSLTGADSDVSGLSDAMRETSTY